MVCYLVFIVSAYVMRRKPQISDALNSYVFFKNGVRLGLYLAFVTVLRLGRRKDGDKPILMA